MIVFNRQYLTIEVPLPSHGQFYEVDLERCNTSAQMLDWIFQLQGKTWMTPELMREFLATLNRACIEIFQESVQGCFCSCGNNYQVDWKAGTRRLVK